MMCSSELKDAARMQTRSTPVQSGAI